MGIRSRNWPRENWYVRSFIDNSDLKIYAMKKTFTCLVNRWVQGPGRVGGVEQLFYAMHAAPVVTHVKGKLPTKQNSLTKCITSFNLY